MRTSTNSRWRITHAPYTIGTSSSQRIRAVRIDETVGLTSKPRTTASERAPASERPHAACVAGERSDCSCGQVPVVAHQHVPGDQLRGVAGEEDGGADQLA